jgi:hypothetical protein
MPLHQRHRFQRPGWPEVLALAAVLATIAAAVAWSNAATAPNLEQTPGTILACDVRLTHYNADGLLPKVLVDYAYTAGIGTYTGHWEGYWPSTKSPDALPPDKLDLLKSPGRIITVFYDPADPRKSVLHNAATRFSAVYAFAAAITAVAAIIYLVRIYPAWKR